MSNKLGQEPAFPVDSQAFSTIVGRGHEPIGMSKRFYAACAAMQGLLSSEILTSALEREANEKEIAFGQALIINAYDFADELLKQENA